MASQQFFSMNAGNGVVAATALCAVLMTASAQAALLTLDGASFDAPAACQLAGGALVCKEDGQQLELWVYRTPLKSASNEAVAARMARLADIHQAALKNIMATPGSTGNDGNSSFASYGKYVATGSMLAGKGTVSAPSVRLATVLSGDDVFQIVEVVALRAPRIEALASGLQRSLRLPGDGVETADVASVANPASAGVNADSGNPETARFAGKLLSFHYPSTLELVVIDDSASALSVGLRHKARTSGPNVTINLRAANDAAIVSAAVSVEKRKQQSLAAMLPGSATVEVKKLGAINGAGYALIGTPDAKKGFSGIESIETMFAADTRGRLLEIRLTAEQKNSADMEAVWTLLGKTINLATP